MAEFNFVDELAEIVELLEEIPMPEPEEDIEVYSFDVGMRINYILYQINMLRNKYIAHETELQLLRNKLERIQNVIYEYEDMGDYRPFTEIKRILKK